MTNLTAAIREAGTPDNWRSRRTNAYVPGHLQQEILKALEREPLYFGTLRRRVNREWSTVHQSIEKLKKRGLVTEERGKMIRLTNAS